MTENWKKLKRLQKINEEIPVVHRELMKLVIEGLQIIDELGLAPIELKRSTEHIIKNMNMNMSKKNKTEIN